MSKKLSHILACFFIKKKWIEKEYQKVYEYAYEWVIYSICQTILIIILGAVFHVLAQTICFISIFYLLRRKTGGYHAPTRFECTIIVILLWAFCMGSAYSLYTMKNSTYWVIIIGCVVVYLMTLVLYVPLPSKVNEQDELQLEKNRESAKVYTTIIFIVAAFLYYFYPKLAEVIAISLFEIAILIIVEVVDRKEKKI